MGIFNHKKLDESMCVPEQPPVRQMELHIYAVTPTNDISWSRVHDAAYGAQRDVHAINVGGPDIDPGIVRIQVLDGKDVAVDTLHILCYVMDSAKVPGNAGDREVQNNDNMDKIIKAMLKIDPAVVDAMRPVMIIHNIQGDTASNAVRMLP